MGIGWLGRGGPRRRYRDRHARSHAAFNRQHSAKHRRVARHTGAHATGGHDRQPARRYSGFVRSHAARTRRACRGGEPGAATLRAVSNKPSAEFTYDHEIARLLAVYKFKQHDLDSSTVAVVAKNMAIIDEAIAQCRLALRRDPVSGYLMQSLNDALDTKVQLLRTAAALPASRM